MFYRELPIDYVFARKTLFMDNGEKLQWVTGTQWATAQLQSQPYIFKVEHHHKTTLHMVTYCE